VIRTFLETPPIERVAPDGVFDAYGWCASDLLEWRCPTQRLDLDTPLAGEDGATWLGRMVFVFRRPCAFLPRELARLHAFGLGLDEEEALAPYAIDDATDELYARRARPRDVLWLAADGLNALFWGLHDWSHFHNHGPFRERSWTELQCDAASLVWLWRNRSAIGISDGRFASLREEVRSLSRGRFEADGVPFEGGPRAAFERATRTFCG
jgi:hypothetical protein